MLHIRTLAVPIGWRQSGQALCQLCRLSTGQTGHKQQPPISSDQLLKSGPTEVPDLLKNPHYANRMVIYKYKHIMTINLVSSFKVVQTGAVVFMAAANGVGTIFGYQTADAFGFLLPVGVISLGVLCGASLLFRRVVGEISVDGRDRNVVYLAHVGFWGRRCNLAVHRDQLTLTRESNNFSMLEVAGHPHPFYLGLRQSGRRASNEEQLDQLFRAELPVQELFKEAAARQQRRQKLLS